MSNIKDTLTNVISIIIVVATAIKTYVDSLCTDCTIDWWQLIAGIGVAVIAYFTGKTADGKKKSVVLLEKQKELS